jgi:hypothetical protein
VVNLDGLVGLGIVVGVVYLVKRVGREYLVRPDGPDGVELVLVVKQDGVDGVDLV